MLLRHVNSMYGDRLSPYWTNKLVNTRRLNAKFKALTIYMDQGTNAEKHIAPTNF